MEAGKTPPYLVNALCDQGSIYACRGDLALSEKKFREAMEIDSDNVRTLSQFACFCHTGLRDYDLARKYYERVLILSPDHLNTLCCFAELLASPSYRERNNSRADLLLEKAKRIAVTEEQKEHVNAVLESVANVRKLEKEEQKAKEEHHKMMEAAYLEATTPKPKSKKKGSKSRPSTQASGKSAASKKK